MKEMIADNTDLLVIGGGAAGMMCAATAADRGLKVILLDSNRQLGRKLRITGKGRCNLTNNCDIKTFMQNIPGDGRFLFSALNRLSPADTMALFESRGLPLKTERGNRVFPVSDNANDVAGTMARWCARSGVIVERCKAKKVVAENGAVTGVETEKGLIRCRAAAVCTGGLSYPLTGSTGDGLMFAEALGHSVTPPRASLVPLESPDAYCAEMQGFSLRNVVLSAYEEDKLIYKELGEMLFTHFGVSGPLVLSASAHMRHMGSKNYRLEIDLKPALDEKKLDARILRDFEKYANREFKNSLSDLAGSAMIPVLVRLSGIPEDIKVNSITREQRMKLLHLFKAFPVSVSGTRPIDEAIVTAGGVNTKEINPRTMESKLISELYFAGEVLDLDGYTGGFNLQIAWSTGFVAGNSVLKDAF
ncbi:MAG: NAD(P)/FAD-dependent oxidoreductase [Candidatus Limivicinus sp.]